MIKITSIFCQYFNFIFALTSTKDLKDLAGTRKLKTKNRVKLQRKKVPFDKTLSLMYYIEVYPYFGQVFFVNFSSGKS